MKKITVHFKLNGKEIEEEIFPNTLLVDFIRDQMGLTGTKKGCGTGECGACTVLLDGEPVTSCLILACQANGRSITTIEGFSHNGEPSEIQKRFVEEGAIQCGFCTPGFIVSAEALLRENPHPAEEQIREAVSGNLCRCTGYKKIVQAIKKASSHKK